MLIGVACISLLGLLICLYGAYVERKVTADHSYKAVCDISDRASCTKTFLSPWGKLFGISNISLGILFYSAMILISFAHVPLLAFLAALAACVASVYLAYILYAKVQTFCLLCASIYVINSILLVVSYYSF